MSTATLPRSRQAPPTAPVAGSAVYVGWVTHRRRSPVEHRFRYPTAMLLLDLDELPGALEGHRHWGVERRALFAFRRRDHHGDPAVPLAEALRRTAAEATGRWAGGPVRLLCQPRTLGRSFNPVTFAYLHDADRQLDAVVAEVTNTPWGERHAYVLDARAAADPERPATTLDKAFHVSPFMGMDHRYRWTTTVPGPALHVHLASDRDGERVFDATLALHRRPLDAAGLRAYARRQPLGALLVLARIYGQALRLALKRVPVHPHPADRETTTR